MEDIKQRGIPVSANFSLEGLLTTDATVQSTFPPYSDLYSKLLYCDVLCCIVLYLLTKHSIVNSAML